MSNRSALGRISWGRRGVGGSEQEFGNSRAMNGHPCGEGIPPTPSAVLAPWQPGKTWVGRCTTIPISSTIGLTTPAWQRTFPLPWDVAGCKSGYGLIAAAQPPAQLSHASPRGNWKTVLPPEHRWERRQLHREGFSVSCAALGLWPLTPSISLVCWETCTAEVLASRWLNTWFVRCYSPGTSLKFGVLSLRGKREESGRNEESSVRTPKPAASPLCE